MAGWLTLYESGLPAGARGVFTTSVGGVGDGTNLSARDGLDDYVAGNRGVLAGEVGLGDRDLVFAQQVHGVEVAVVDHVSARAQRGGIRATDGLVSRRPDLGLVILAADCMPVLFADVAAGVVGAAHAGRPGLVAGVLEATVTEMVGQGADPAHITAVVGPSICGRCYELPAAMVAELDERMPGLAATTSWGTPSIDLRAGAGLALASVGVAGVRHVGGCTYEQPALLHSYRRDGTRRRHGGLVRLT